MSCWTEWQSDRSLSLMTMMGPCPSHQSWGKQTSKSEISCWPQHSLAPLLSQPPQLKSCLGPHWDLQGLGPPLLLFPSSPPWALLWPGLCSASMILTLFLESTIFSHPNSSNFQLHPHHLHSLLWLVQPLGLVCYSLFSSCPQQISSPLTSLRRLEKARTVNILNFLPSFCF